MAKFADYGFNKSHAAAYALIAYQTAWFKAHYPVEFIAASMTFEKSNTDKLAEFRHEARRLGIVVEPPSICRSGADFDVAPGKDGKLAIRYALGAIKGVGDGQAASIVASRGEKPFSSLADFARRINPREVNKKVLENLACCGAFDELEPDRARVFAGAETILACANRCADERQMGQNALFGEEQNESLALPKAAPDSRRTVAARVRRGRVFPFRPPARRLSRRIEASAAVSLERVRRGGQARRLGGEGRGDRADRAERRTKSGSKMGIVQFSDDPGSMRRSCSRRGSTIPRPPGKGRGRVVTLSGSLEGDEVRARIVAAKSLAAAAARAQKGLRIFVRDAGPLDGIKTRLSAKGEGEVSLVVMRDASGEEIEMKLPGGSRRRGSRGRVEGDSGRGRGGACVRRDLIYLRRSRCRAGHHCESRRACEGRPSGGRVWRRSNPGVAQSSRRASLRSQ